jgi:hypothetical protein
MPLRPPHRGSAGAGRARISVVVGVLLALAALACSTQAHAGFYKGKGKNDPKVRIYMLAGEKGVKFFLPRHYRIRFDDEDQTKVRVPGNDELNTKELPLVKRPNGRWRFVQHFMGEEKGTKVRIDIVGSFNRSLTRARGRFRLRLLLGSDEDLPEGTRGTSGRVRWKASRR